MRIIKEKKKLNSITYEKHVMTDLFNKNIGK